MSAYGTLRTMARVIRDRLSSRDLPTKMRLGEYGLDQWVVLLRLLSADSVVYSGGVGNDIAFERHLQSLVGCEIYLFDPSPTGEITMSRPENQRSSFHFQKLGLTGEAGEFSFAPPADPAEGSYAIDPAEGADLVMMSCDTVPAIAARLGHSHIDLLKIDIEGAEYGVIDGILAGTIPVHQICVEFHPSFSKDGRQQTRRAIAQLKKHGYTMINRYCNDFTFVLKD